MANKKLKLLYLAQYLWEQTDEQHPGTMQEIIAYLASCGISAERKSLYDDLELLRLYGMDVQSVKGRSFGYFLGERDFQLPELKLLIDVVQASPFLTRGKSLELIGKLEKLTSRPNARQLRRQVRGDEIFKNLAGGRRIGSGFDDHGISGCDRIHRRFQRQHEGIVPGTHDQHGAIGLPQDITGRRKLCQRRRHQSRTGQGE